MKKFTNLLLLCLVVMFLSDGCKGDRTGQGPDRSGLKIIMMDSLSVQEEDDGRRLPENIRDLCSVLISETKDCERIFILDPVITRLDLNKTLSLKTAIEKGGAKNVENPNVIGKLIQKNFDEIEVPREFTTRQASNINAGALIKKLSTTESVNDSILIVNENSSLDKYELNGKQYKVFTSMEEVRTKISSLLCQNDKTNFTIFINPPLLNTGISIVPKPVEPPVYSPKPASPRSTKRQINSGGGDLVMVKGSEGCDVCTRYYSAVDNAGRIRQITEKNSTNCCPCGKDIVLRGRTYRMNCDDTGGNRLESVD